MAYLRPVLRFIVPTFMLVLAVLMTVDSGLVYASNPPVAYGFPKNFTGYVGLCAGGVNCVSGTHSNGFTCTVATCTGLASGSGDGQLNDPYGVFVDSSGNVYVADFFNYRVDKFSSSGSFLGWAGACTGGTNCVSSTHSNGFTCTAATCTGAGTSGSGDGQFNNPTGVFVDSSGNLYFADYGNNRVVKFSGGVFSGWAGKCTGGTNCITTGGADQSNGFTCTAATCSGLATGSGDGQFNGPTSVFVDSSGNLYISDEANDRVVKFSGGVFSGWAGLCSSGTNCDTSGGADHSNGFTCTDATCSGLTSGSGDGQFRSPWSVAADSSGNIYISDQNSYRVDLFSASGFVGWAGGCTSGTNCDTSGGADHSNGFTCTAATCAGAAGSGDGQFNDPLGVSVSPSGTIYVSDQNGYRVDLFSASGFVGWAGLCTSGSNCDTTGGADHSNGFTCTDATCSGLTFGSGDGQFGGPFGVGVDSSGNVYVSDQNNDRVELFLSRVADLAGFTGYASGVLLVLGDFQLNPHGSKPLGVGYQSGRDTTPVGFVSGMLATDQLYTFDTNTGYVDSTGRPVVSGNSVIFVIGGPLINAVSHYYQTTGVNADRSPVSLSSVGSNYVWTDKNGTVALSVPQSSDAVPPGTSDVFSIQLFTDSSGRQVVLMYGTTYLGTWAAAYYFKYVLYPNISTYTNGYYLIRWTDASSGAAADFIPDGGDTFTILATAPS